MKSNVQIESEKVLNKKMALLLRAWDEINYAFSKNKELNNMVIIDEPEILIKKTDDKVVCLTDKGETIFSVKELNKLCKQIYKYLQKRYPINYKYQDIDPIYFSLFLYDKLPKIVKITIDNIKLSELRLIRNNGSISLEETECFKALELGNDCTIYTPFNSNHIVDSDYERLMTSFESIKKNGYPFLNRYITVYNDEPYVRDGQHRACILKKMYGNISVPILRIYLEKEKNDKEKL